MNWIRFLFIPVFIYLFACSPAKNKSGHPIGKTHQSLWFKIQVNDTNDTYVFRLLRNRKINALTKSIFSTEIPGNTLQEGKWLIKIIRDEKPVYSIPLDNPLIKRYETADDHGEMHSHVVRLKTAVIQLRIPYADNLKSIIFEEKKVGEMHPLGVVYIP